MTRIKDPHDSLFRETMANKAFALAYFKQHLPADIKKLIDLNTIKLEKDTYVDERLRKQMSDLVYSAKTKTGKKAYIYLLVEHLSNPQRFFPLKVISYLIKLWEQEIKQGAKYLPLVFPMVLYHGKESPYPYSMNFFDLFGEQEQARKIFNNPIHLIDLTTIPDKTLQQNTLTAFMQVILKHAFERDLLPYIRELAQLGILEALDKNEKMRDHMVSMVYYITNTVEITDIVEFKELLIQHSGHIKEDVMTIFQHYEKKSRIARLEGRQEGKQEGREEGIIEIAKNMLVKGFDINVIKELTGLSISQLKKLH